MAERFIQKELGVLTIQQQGGSIDYCPLKPEVDCNIVNGQFVVTVGGQPAMDNMGNQVGPYVYDGAYLPYTSVPVIGGSFITPEQAGAKIDSLDLVQYTPQTQPQEVLIEVSGNNNRSPIVPIAASLVTVALLVVAGKRIKHKLDMLGDIRFRKEAKPDVPVKTLSNAEKKKQWNDKFEANYADKIAHQEAIVVLQTQLENITPLINELNRKIVAQEAHGYYEPSSPYNKHYLSLIEQRDKLNQKVASITNEKTKLDEKYEARSK